MWCIIDCELMTWSLWNLVRPFFLVTMVSIGRSSCISFISISIPGIYEYCAGIWLYQQLLLLGSKNISRSQNRRFWFLEKIRIKRTINPGYFKNLKEPVVFMKEAAMNSWFYFVCENNQNKHDYIPEPVLWFFRITVMNTQNHPISIQVCSYF